MLLLRITYFFNLYTFNRELKKRREAQKAERKARKQQTISGGGVQEKGARQRGTATKGR